jgi:hypothetical protein
MSGDFALAEGITFGEWVHAQLHRHVTFEREGWAVERVQRIADRLQGGRPILERVYVEVPWLQLRTAFTLPGRYIYFGRGLLEYCPDDETAAFVIAHELAHHDLGHLNLFPHWMGLLVRRWGGQAVMFAMEGVERRLYGPERECEADRRGLELCIAAGYDPTRCLHFFPIYEQLALDVGDTDMVYGPDAESDDELSPQATFYTKVRIWSWQRTRGYLPLRDRHAALLRFLAEAKASALRPA